MKWARLVRSAGKRCAKNEANSRKRRVRAPRRLSANFVGIDMKLLVITLLLSVAFTTLTMMLPYDGCVCGEYRGFPFRVVGPICGSSRLHVALDKRPKCTQTVFDCRGFTADILAYTAIILLARYGFRRSRHVPSAELAHPLRLRRTRCLATHPER